MVSGVADSVWTAAGVVGERVVVHTFRDAECVIGEVDETSEMIGAASVRPIPRTARANASAALTSANASDAVRMVSPEHRGSAER
jgi:hypothetical protein